MVSTVILLFLPDFIAELSSMFASLYMYCQIAYIRTFINAITIFKVKTGLQTIEPKKKTNNNKNSNVGNVHGRRQRIPCTVR